MWFDKLTMTWSLTMTRKKKARVSGPFFFVPDLEVVFGGEGGLFVFVLVAEFFEIGIFVMFILVLLFRPSGLLGEQA